MIAKMSASSSYLTQGFQQRSFPKCKLDHSHAVRNTSTTNQSKTGISTRVQMTYVQRINLDLSGFEDFFFILSVYIFDWLFQVNFCANRVRKLHLTDNFTQLLCDSTGRQLSLKLKRGIFWNRFGPSRDFSRSEVWKRLPLRFQCTVNEMSEHLCFQAIITHVEILFVCAMAELQPSQTHAAGTHWD